MRRRAGGDGSVELVGGTQRLDPDVGCSPGSLSVFQAEPLSLPANCTFKNQQGKKRKKKEASHL